MSKEQNKRKTESNDMKSKENSSQRTRHNTWAEVAANNRNMKQLPPSMRDKINRMKQSLIQNKCIELQKPKVTPLYFKNIKRCRIGGIRAALRETLPSWAVLGLSFVGGSILEVLCDEKLQRRLVYTLALVNIRQVKNFDVLKDGVKHLKNDKLSKIKNIDGAKRRLERCVTTTTSQYAREWYINQVARCAQILEEEQQHKETVNKTNTDGEWQKVEHSNKIYTTTHNQITIPEKNIGTIHDINELMRDQEISDKKIEVEYRPEKELSLQLDIESDVEDADWTMEDEKTSTRTETSDEHMEETQNLIDQRGVSELLQECTPGEIEVARRREVAQRRSTK